MTVSLGRARIWAGAEGEPSAGSRVVAAANVARRLVVLFLATGAQMGLRGPGVK
jgi:hypothetical protein